MDLKHAWILKLLAWYRANRRDLPWRSAPGVTPDPYRVWISEIMLQQTRVETVIPFYEKFLCRFPDVKSLAAADLHDVLLLWQGLGYYSRAENLHRAAKQIADEQAGFPNTFRKLRELPGFGEYTAAAVAGIAFGEPVPVVDGNVLRVWSRFTLIEEDVRMPAVRKRVFHDLVPCIEESGDPATFNQSIMELGALVCRPKNPRCPDCPLVFMCAAAKENRTEDLPLRTAKKKTPEYDVAVAAIERNGKWLIVRRPPDGMLANLWEFPGGRCVGQGREMKRRLVAKVKAETGYGIDALGKCGIVSHAFSHFSVRIHVFRARVVSGRMKRNPRHLLEWVAAESFGEYPFPSVNRKVIALLPGIGRQSGE